MDGEQGRHGRAPPRRPGHPLQQEKQQQRVAEVQDEVDHVGTAGVGLAARALKPNISMSSMCDHQVSGCQLLCSPKIRYSATMKFSVTSPLCTCRLSST